MVNSLSAGAKALGDWIQTKGDRKVYRRITWQQKWVLQTCNHGKLEPANPMTRNVRFYVRW
jgi:hypothetical protein